MERGKERLEKKSMRDEGREREGRMEREEKRKQKRGM